MVTSQRSEAGAQAAFLSLRAKFPDQLSGREPIIRRADLGAKGVYYRVLVGPFASMEEADGLCSSLKAAGGNCIVQGSSSDKMAVNAPPVTLPTPPATGYSVTGNWAAQVTCPGLPFLDPPKPTQLKVHLVQNTNGEITGELGLLPISGVIRNDRVTLTFKPLLAPPEKDNLILLGTARMEGDSEGGLGTACKVVMTKLP